MKRHRWVYPGGDYSFTADLTGEWACEEQPEKTMMLADVVAVIGTQDIVFGEIDR